MNSGKIVLIIFVILATVIGLTTIQDYSSEENEKVNVDDLSSGDKTVKIEISDGIGSADNG